MAEAYIARTALHNGPRSAIAISSNAGPGEHLGKPGHKAGATIGQSIMSVTGDLSIVNRIGWVKQSIEHRNVDLSHIPDSGTSMVQLVMDLVHDDHGFNGEEKESINHSLNSLTKREDPHQRELFNAFVRKGRNIVFAVSAAGSKNGNLTLRTIGFECEATEEITDCLVFKVTKKNIKISLVIVDFVAIQGVLDATRHAVEEKINRSNGVWIHDIRLI
ncbi:hypothetical protein BD779DRAFT_1476745 [Infundibulicybe gibba]|nr:hypothetical protein BD779DRAFT_1476745 [Infundibulicybe gibba]